MDALPVLPGSVQLYVGSTLAAVDNGLGGWTGQNGYTLAGCKLYNYGLSRRKQFIAFTGGNAIYIRYQQNNLGDIAPTQNQIGEYISNSAIYTYIGY